MAVRPHPSGEKNYWIIDCWPEGRKGKRQRIPFHGSEVEAMAAEAELLRSARQPANIIAPMIVELYPDWTAYYKNHVANSTYLDAIFCFKQLLQFFGHMKPNHLNMLIIDQYKAKRLETVKKRTINKELTYLSALLRWAEERKYINPLTFKIKGFPARQAKARKPRPLSVEEVNRIYNLIEPEYKLPFLLMADAGLRRNEALRLRAEDVNMRLCLIRITGKGDKEAIIPILTDRLFEELACKEDVTGYLCLNPKTGKPYYGIRKALVRAAEKAGLGQHLHHHLLRHSFGTIATISGMNPHAIREIMRHSDISTTMIYQNLAADFLKSEGRKFLSNGG